MEINERREYYRLKEDLSIHFREIEASDLDRVRERMAYESSNFTVDHIWLSSGREKKYERNKEYELIIAYFEMLSNKLDMILERIEERKDGPHFLRSVLTLDVSGSGVRFVSPKKPEKPYLELLISLPGCYPPRIRTIAEVLRVEESVKEGNVVWEIAARYIEIMEKARDLLVRYIIEREREMIKKSKADE